MFSGMQKDFLYNELYVFDVFTCIWKKFFCLEGPYNRVMSSFTCSSDSRFLIGGASVPEGLLLNDVWYLDFTGVDWNEAYDLSGAKWTMLEFVEGKEVPFLKGHSTSMIDDENLILFGGFD